MKNLFSILFSFAVLLANSQASNWKWARGYSSYGSDYGTAVAVDTAGNVISIGSLHSWSLSCGNTLLLKNGNLLDFVVLKHDPNGNLLWAKSFGGTYEDNAYAVTTDPNNNIFICGSFNSTLVTFGSFTVSGNGSESSFLAKLSPAGNVLWVKTSSGQPTNMGKSPLCRPFAVAADNMGNACITGVQNTSVVCFGTFTLNYGWQGGAFVVKYDGNGNELWASGPAGAGISRANDAAFDGSGNIYVTGYINGAVSFGSYSLNPVNSIKCFIAKYGPGGNVLWASTPTGSAFSEGNAITCDKNRNVIVSGECKGSSSFGQVSVNTATFGAMLIKADSLGNFLWGATATGEGSGEGVAADLNANITWTGRFSNSKTALTFGNITVNPTGNNPGFITRYDANGNALCADFIDCGGATSGGLAVNSSGDAFLCSEYSVDPFIVGQDTLHIQILTNDSHGHYIAKWNCGSTITSIPQRELKSLSLFPVPVERYLNIDIENASAYSNYRLAVKNIQGQLVVSQRFDNVLDCSLLTPGVYFLEVSTVSGDSFRGKFIKQ